MNMSFTRYRPTYTTSGRYPSWIVYFNDSRPGGKKTSKTFSIKKYKTHDLAYRAALAFAQDQNHFLYNKENIEL